MILGKSRVPVSGCLAAASAWAAAVRASSICLGVMLRRRRFNTAMPGRAVDVDHRRGVLVGGEGECSLPVERILGGDRLVERCRAGSGVIALLAPETQSVAGLEGAAADQARPARQVARLRPEPECG